MINQQLVDYIEQQLSSGTPVNDIKKSLRNSGWRDADINEAFSGLTMSNNNTPSKKKIIWIIIIVLVILTVVIGLLVLYLWGPRVELAASPTPSPSVSSSPVESSDSSKILSPKESYLKMKAEFDNIKNYADLLAFSTKYGSKSQIAKIEANQDKVNAMPESTRDQIATAAVALSPKLSEITTIQEDINGETAALTISSTKPNLIGVVIMVLEDGQWKLDRESWK